MGYCPFGSTFEPLSGSSALHPAQGEQRDRERESEMGRERTGTERERERVKEQAEQEKIEIPERFVKKKTQNKESNNGKERETASIL